MASLYMGNTMSGGQYCKVRAADLDKSEALDFYPTTELQAAWVISRFGHVGDLTT